MKGGGQARLTTLTRDVAGVRLVGVRGGIRTLTSGRNPRTGDSSPWPGILAPVIPVVQPGCRRHGRTGCARGVCVRTAGRLTNHWTSSRPQAFGYSARYDQRRHGARPATGGSNAYRAKPGATCEAPASADDGVSAAGGSWCDTGGNAPPQCLVRSRSASLPPAAPLAGNPLSLSPSGQPNVTAGG